MILVCTASADTYITNKIINGHLQATDANVGKAATLDIFKLYDENKLNGISGQIELSRVLLKFDLQQVYDMTGSTLDLNSPNFKALLLLSDISSGFTTPRNFNIVAFPLSQSFDEGVGRDVAAFNDIDVANFITASYTGQSNRWFTSGANAGGLLGSSDIDYISSGNLGFGVVDLSAKQNFVNGNEDLVIDVTTIVSATIAGLIPNNGFRLSFIASEETDSKTRFVKRFATRHVSNAILRPKLYVKFNDSIKDDSGDFRFDVSGTLFLQSFNGSNTMNIVSGSSLSPVTGSNCFIFQLNNKDYNFYTSGSQYSAGTENNFMSGVYTAAFALPSSDTHIITGSLRLCDLIAASGSVTFKTYWNSLDMTVCYHTGSLTVTRTNRQAADFTSRRPMINLTNLYPEYRPNDIVRLRAFGVDAIRQIRNPVKRPLDLLSEIYENVYYQVYDVETNATVIPYDVIHGATQLSTDSKGMFFDFKMQALTTGRSYGFEFYIIDMGSTFLYRDPDSNFTVRP